jgi:PEP-CTERM motif
MKRVFLAASAAVALIAGAPAAYAATTFTKLDQASLDAFGTSTFGAIITTSGIFDHVFTFTTSGLNDASSFIGTISLANGKKDIDFTSIDLDGLFSFVKNSGDPSERWDLSNAVIGAGVHTINVHGTVVTTGTALNAASYSGTLNLSSLAVPEPATWGLMIVGFGGIGAVIRSRRRIGAAVA